LSQHSEENGTLVVEAQRVISDRPVFNGGAKFRGAFGIALSADDLETVQHA
jgi:hypothetical protein